MNLLDLLPQSLFLRVAGWLLVVAVVVGSLWAITNHFENVGYQKRVAEEQVQQNIDLQIAAGVTQELQSKLNKAQYELSISKQKLSALSNDNRRISNSLRDSIAGYNRNLPDYSREALTDRINALGSVFSECTSQYVEVARKADSYVGELKMMQEAWPK